MGGEGKGEKFLAISFGCPGVLLGEKAAVHPLLLVGCQKLYYWTLPAPISPQAGSEGF